MLEELGGERLIHRVGAGQFQGDGQHLEGEESHPGGAVRLVEAPTARERGAPVEQADVVETQEPSLKHVVAVGVLAVHPPGEVEQQLVEHPFQEGSVPGSGRCSVDLVHPAGRPGVDRRVDVAELPFVGGELPVGMHVPLAGHQLELALGEAGVDAGEGDAMEGEVPGGEPRVLPSVRHREHVEVVQVLPLMVAAPAAVRAAGAVRPDRPPTTVPRRSSRAASTRSSRPGLSGG